MFKSGDILDDRYEVVRVLGCGGMSTVYLCRNVRLGNLWAIKEVRDEIRQYLNSCGEHDILKRLDCRGIPKIIDIFYRKDNLYIVEEYIEGQTLENYVSTRGKLSLIDVCSIVLKLCDIINYLHTQDPPVIYVSVKYLHYVFINILYISMVSEFFKVKKQCPPFSCYT